MSTLPHGYDPHDVALVLSEIAPGSQVEFITERDTYRFKATATDAQLTEAIRRVTAGDLSHIVRRLVPKIKARASEIILARKGLPAQINQLARGLDLLLKHLEGDALTAEELAELHVGRDLYRNFVQPIRARSNELEAELLTMTRAQLLAAELANWPDEVWPL